MYSFFKNILNTSKVDANAIEDKDEHKNIESLEATVESTVAQKSDSDATMQVVMSKESIFTEVLKDSVQNAVAENLDNDETIQTMIDKENVFAKVLQDSVDELKTCPCIVLNDCMSESSHLKKKSDSSDCKRPQRKCAKIATRRISDICCRLDETQTRSLDFNRSHHKRLCAKVAENRISEIVDMISAESDADDESEMSETEMSEAEMSESD